MARTLPYRCLFLLAPALCAVFAVEPVAGTSAVSPPPVRLGGVPEAAGVGAEAVARLQGALDADPGNPEALAGLAIFHLGWTSVPTSSSGFNGPGAASARRFGRSRDGVDLPNRAGLGRALSYVLRLLARAPDHPFLAGHFVLWSALPESAPTVCEFYRARAARARGDADVLLRLGLSSWASGRFSASGLAFEKLAARDPSGEVLLETPGNEYLVTVSYPPPPGREAPSWNDGSYLGYLGYTPPGQRCAPSGETGKALALLAGIRRLYPADPTVVRAFANILVASHRYREGIEYMSRQLSTLGTEEVGARDPALDLALLIGLGRCYLGIRGPFLGSQSAETEGLERVVREIRTRFPVQARTDPAVLALFATVETQKGNTGTASVLIRKLEPTNPLLIYQHVIEMMNIETESGLDHDKIVAFYRERMGPGPFQEQYREGFGTYLLNSHQSAARTLPFFEERAREASTDPVWLFGLANARIVGHDHARAREALDALDRLPPNRFQTLGRVTRSFLATLEGRYLEAEGLLSRALADASPTAIGTEAFLFQDLYNRASLLMALSALHRKLGDRTAAIADLREATVADAHDPEGFDLLERALCAQGDTTGAIELRLGQVRSNAANTAAWARLAVLRAAIGDRAPAIAAIERAEALQAGASTPLHKLEYHRGRVHDLLGEPEAARASYRAFLGHPPDLLRSQDELGMSDLLPPSGLCRAAAALRLGRRREAFAALQGEIGRFGPWDQVTYVVDGSDDLRGLIEVTDLDLFDAHERALADRGSAFTEGTGEIVEILAAMQPRAADERKTLEDQLVALRRSDREAVGGASSHANQRAGFRDDLRVAPGRDTGRWYTLGVLGATLARRAAPGEGAHRSDLRAAVSAFLDEVERAATTGEVEAVPRTIAVAWAAALARGEPGAPRAEGFLRALRAEVDGGALPVALRVLLEGVRARLDPASPAVDWNALVSRYLEADPEGAWILFLYERFGIRP